MVVISKCTTGDDRLTWLTEPVEIQCKYSGGTSGDASSDQGALRRLERRLLRPRGRLALFARWRQAQMQTRLRGAIQEVVSLIPMLQNSSMPDLQGCAPRQEPPTCDSRVPRLRPRLLRAGNRRQKQLLSGSFTSHPAKRVSDC